MNDGIPWVERQVLDTFARMYERFEQDRNLIPDGHLAEVRYEELIADPVGQMQSVYEQLDLGGFEQVRPAIAAVRRRAQRLPPRPLLSLARHHRTRPPPLGAVLRTLRLQSSCRRRDRVARSSNPAWAIDVTKPASERPLSFPPD